MINTVCRGMAFAKLCILSRTDRVQCFVNAWKNTARKGVIRPMISFEDFIMEDDSPIYLQVIRYIKRGIVAGTIKDQEEVPSRRVLSALLGVNPNTIQKAYHLLEEEEIILSRTGAKSYVTVDEEKILRIRRELLLGETRNWVNAMKQMNVSAREAEALVKEIWKMTEERQL